MWRCKKTLGCSECHLNTGREGCGRECKWFQGKVHGQPMDVSVTHFVHSFKDFGSTIEKYSSIVCCLSFEERGMKGERRGRDTLREIRRNGAR